MACRLSGDQVEALFKAVHGSVIASKNNGSKYDAEVFMRDLFNLLTTNGADPVNAMDYIQHVPALLLLSSASSTESGDHMVDSGVDLNKLTKLNRDFKADVQNVAKYLDVNKGMQEVVKEIINESLPETGVIPTETYDKIESKDASNPPVFTAYPETAFSVFNQEAKGYDGFDVKSNVVDDDPVKLAYYAVVRKINDLLANNNLLNADSLEYDGIQGIFLRLVPGSFIPMKRLSAADRAYLTTDSEKLTSAQKMQKLEREDVYLVYTDKNGNILYFDTDGKISDKDNGHIAYGKLRKPYTDFRTGEKVVRNVQTPAEVSKNTGASIEESIARRYEEMDVLEKARNFVLANRTETLLFSVSTGSDGYILEDYKKPTLISKIKLDNGFHPIANNSRDNSGPLKSSGVYFAVPGFSAPVLIRRPKFGQLPSLVQNLADIVFGDQFSDADKIKILKQFSYSKDTNIYLADGKLTVKQREVILDPSVQEDKVKFIENLSKQTVNINKDLLNGYFENPVNLDGNITLQNDRYNNFLANNFYTYLSVNADNEIVKLNAYNVIGLNASSQKKLFPSQTETTAKKESTLEQSTPTDVTLDDLRGLLNNSDFSLKKITGLDNAATKEQIQKALEWYTNSPMAKAKVVPFQVAFNIVNSNALAEFTLSGITLFNGSNYTDLYHEAWHAFSQMYLTKLDKIRLYSEGRNLIGSFKTTSGKTVTFKDATDFELEEYFAEDFRKYALSDGKYILSGRSARNTIFRKIWNAIKMLFQGYSLKDVYADFKAVKSINELYNNLYLGNLNDYTPSINNVQFTLLNKGAESVDGQDSLNYQDSLVLVESIDSIMASVLSQLASEGSGGGVATVFTRPELLVPIYEFIRRRLVDKLKDLKPEDTNAKRILEFAVNNWGDFAEVSANRQIKGVIAFHRSRSSYLNFEDKLADLSPDQVDEKQESGETQTADSALGKTETELRENYGANAFERKGNENTVLELASGEIIYLIKSLPRIGKDGKVEYNVLGDPKLVDFNRTWGIVINAVQGAVDTEQMYKRLMDASGRFPELKVLANRLGNPLSRTKKEDWPFIKMWAKFFRDFSVARIPIKEGRLVQTEEDEGNLDFSFSFTETDPLFRQVERQFVNQFQSDKSSKYIKHTDAGNILDVDAVLKRFTAGKLFGEDSKGRGQIIDSDEVIGFLHAIGFYLTDNNAVRQALSDNYAAVYNIHRALVDKFSNSKISITNPIESLRKGGESTRVSQILTIEAANSGNYSNNSVASVTGDPIFDLSLNNTITKLLAELNNTREDYSSLMNKPHLQHFDYRKNPFAKASIILNSLFSLPVGKTVDAANISKRKAQGRELSSGFTKLNIVNLNGIKSVIQGVKQEVENGIKTTELDPVSKFLFDLHTMLTDGVIELPRHASKSSAYGISASNLDTPFNQNAKHLYISTGYFADPVKANNATVELLLPKIAAEMERIAIVKSDNFPQILGFQEFSKSFTIFDDILSDDLKTRLIELANVDNSLEVIENPEIKDLIAKDIAAYFEKLFNENKAIFNEMPFLSNDVLFNNRKTSIANLVKSDTGKTYDLTLKNELTDIALKSFTVNAFIHNTEMMALFYGDLALYNHHKEEFHKRNAAVGSTGRVFAHDQAFTQFINNLGRGYAKSKGFEQRTYDGVLSSAVFKDNNVPSLYYDEYVAALVSKGYSKERAEEILGPYAKMNEGDAQGWITFDSYRVLAILQGEWTEDHNRLYNDIIEGKEVDPTKITRFFPARKYQYAGPLKTNKLHIQAFHKFSLVPLIPSLIKGTNMETFHDNLVKQGKDYALFESGSKIATITTNGSAESFYENDDYNAREIKPWVEGMPLYASNDVFIQYLKSQVDIQDTWKNKTIFSTQLRKLIINDLFLDGLPLNEDFEKLVIEFESLLDTLQEYKKKELLKQAGWTEDANGKLSGSSEELMQFVLNELIRLELPDHDIDYVRKGLKSGVFHDLSFSLNSEKIEKLLNSIVVKRLVRQKLNGEQLVQVSGAGFESRNRYTNPSDEEVKKYRGTNDLPSYRPGKGKNGMTTAMKVKIALKGEFYKLLNLRHTDGKKIETLARLNEVIRKDAWLDKNDHRRLITMVGVRIPVQGLNSMEFMEVYEFLPEEAGSIIIPPTEIVAKSGSDFDIDKLTIFQPNIGIKINRNTTRKNLKALQQKYPDLDLSVDNVNIILDAAEDDFETYALTPEDQKVYNVVLKELITEEPSYIKGKGLKATENKIIESIRSILEHPGNFESLIRPNGTDLVKGVADELASQNIQGYDPFEVKTGSKRTITDKKGRIKSVISPTRVLEPRYNLYKHESNNIGKKTLGIGAVDNSYSSIFKRIGLYLENTYTKYSTDGKGNFKTNEKTGQVEKILRAVNIKMKHNRVTVNGKSYVSLSGIDTVTKDKVSDLISQLMNGWVDIEKDAWIFNINGNNIAGPVLLFLLEAGVDFKTAAYFVSQPLVVEYIKELYKVQSPFYRAAGKEKTGQKGLDNFLIRKQFIERFVALPENKMGETILSNKVLEDIIQNNTEKVSFDEGNLFDLISQKNKTSDMAFAGLLHFFQLEDVSKQLTSIKLNVNVDTKPSKSLFSAQQRIAKIQYMEEFTDIVDGGFYDKIKSDTPISSFFIQDFQLGLLKPLMQMRGDETVNRFILDKIAERSIPPIFKDAEKFAAAFHNDLVLYILQNYLKGMDLNTLTEYKDLRLDKTLPVKNVSNKYGAFVKEGTMYVDTKQIAEDFRSKAYSGKGYTDLGLHVVSPNMFNSGSQEQNFQEYASFVIEREYVRSILEPGANESRAQYEKKIAETALTRTFNFYHLFKSANSMVDQFTDIKNRYPELVKDYILFDHIDVENPNPGKDGVKLKTFKFRSSRMDSDLVNALNENLERLADSKTIKVNEQASAYISMFFKRFILAEYLRSGISKSSSSLAKILPPEIIQKLMEEPAAELMKKGFDKAYLDKYFRSVYANWSAANSSSRYKFRNYLGQNELSLEDFFNSYSETMGKEGQSLYKEHLAGPSSTKELIKKNPDKVFVYASSKVQTGNTIAEEFDKAPNSIGVIVADRVTNPWTDATYDTNIKEISESLDRLENKIQDGYEVLWPSDGLTLMNKKQMLSKAPRTYSYLVSELYKRFGHVMPGAEKDLGLRQAIQAEQGITDEEVDTMISSRFSKPETAPTKSEPIQSVEISSNSKGLAAALTNPTELAKRKGNLTESYPVTFNGVTYKDAEEAYQKNKGKYKPEGLDKGSTYDLMVQILKAKLQQHPRLVEEIIKAGGQEWLSKATHQPTNKNTVWETGGQNLFITALQDAYNNLVSEKPSQTILFDSLTEFTPERKEEILTNFAAKHKMTKEQAKAYIDQALQKDPQGTLQALNKKDELGNYCY
jgi:hypothetical protein